MKEGAKVSENEKLDKIPPGLENYEDLSIFDQEKFDKVVKDSYEITVIGDIPLSQEEKEVLRLPPKFAILDNLKEDMLDWDRELGFGKCRYTLLREIQERLDEGNNEEEITEEEYYARIYPIESELDWLILELFIL